MVDLAESDAWAAVSQAAGLNWRAASEESSVELLRSFWAFGVDGLSNIGESLIESILPVVQVIVINRS